MRLARLFPLAATLFALVGVATLTIGLARAQGAEESTPIEAGKNETCFACHGKEGSFDAGSKFQIGEEKLKGSVHKDLSCTDCHSTIEKVPHGDAAKKTKVDCLSCHTETITTSRLIQKDPPGGYTSSVHAHRGSPMDSELPSCVTCHGGDAHAIKSPQKWTKLQTAENCSKCHLDADKMGRHGIHVEAARSYFESFHGKAIQYGSEKTATCVDCHNAHNVQNPKAVIASTNPAQLANTCRHCHPGANYNFSMAGTGHLQLSLEKDPALRYTYAFFYGLAVFTFSMLLVALVLDVRARYRMRLKYPEVDEEIPKNVFVERWSFAQVLQHGLLAFSIATLILTGFPLRFPKARGFATIYQYMGGIDTARYLHRVAGIGLIVVAVWHIGMLLYNWLKSRPAPREWPMLWSRKDYLDLRASAAHYMGKTDDVPRFGKYSFREKLDYMCEYWGVPVMVLSGLILWFPGYFAQHMSGRAISVSYIAHGVEATIAAVVIITWHMYHALVVAGVKNNKAWWNGKVTLAYMKHHHPLEYERIMAQRNAEGKDK